VGTIHFQGADHTIGDGNEGPLTNKLRVALTGIHSGGSERHPEWVFKVPEQG